MYQYQYILHIFRMFQYEQNQMRVWQLSIDSSQSVAVYQLIHCAALFCPYLPKRAHILFGRFLSQHMVSGIDMRWLTDP
jgi:hypothetical protein